ncbi:MAG TPA: MFS transporter [Chthoniobacterales bacterium]|jgi:MFS family permease|nr:MFS transporter [Chthoniobacterales bacterium]
MSDLLTSDLRAPASGVSNVPEDMTGRPRRVATGGISFRKTFSALKHRNFRLYFAGQLISFTGTWMTTTAQGWLVYQLTGSKALLGVVAAAASAPMIVFATWGGWIADRYSKRSVIVCTQISSMILSLSMALLVWTKVVQPWQIIALAIVGGITMAFDMPARQSFVIEMTSREDLMNAISLNSSAFNCARIVGPSIAGLLMAHISIAACFLCDGVSFIPVIAGLLLMRLPKKETQIVSDSGPIGQALEGFRYVWTHRRVLTILALFMVVGIFGWSYSVLMPAFARDVLHLGANGYGLLMAGSGVGALLAALTVASAGHMLPTRTMALGGVWIFSLALVLFAYTRNLYVCIGLLALVGFGVVLYFSTSNTVLQSIVPDEMRGRVMGIWALIFGGMIPLGSLEAGLMADMLGTPATMAIGALICALAAFVTLSVIRRREAQLGPAPR